MADSWREALHHLLARARTDDELRGRLRADPRGTLAGEAGIEVPEGVSVVVVEDTPEAVHLVLPAQGADVGFDVELTDDAVEGVDGAMIGMGMMGLGDAAYGFQGGGQDQAFLKGPL
ncbi:MAG: NHLP leader peptide family RiPP precursor, partial [Actinomycetes bacterium]